MVDPCTVGLFFEAQHVPLFTAVGSVGDPGASTKEKH